MRSLPSGLRECSQHASAVALHAAHFGALPQVQLRAQYARRGIAYRRIAQLCQPVAAAEQRHPHAQPVQRLAQFEADDADAHHRDRCRQIPPFEHVVTDHRALAQRAQFRRDLRTGAGCNDDALGIDDGVLIHLQLPGIEKSCITAQTIAGGDFIDAVQHETDETVALGPYPRHHRLAVNAQWAGMHAEGGRRADGMRGIGGGNQQFAGHAADPRASGAVGSALDQHHPFAVRAGRAIRRQAGCTGTDDRDIDCQCIHSVFPLESRRGRMPAMPGIGPAIRASGCLRNFTLPEHHAA